MTNPAIEKTSLGGLVPSENNFSVNHAVNGCENQPIKQQKKDSPTAGKFSSTSPVRPYRFSITLTDHIADTTHLSAGEHGAYLRLLFSYWRNGPPRDDDKTLARIAGMDVREWTAARPMIEPFFDVQGGSWIHWRLDEELEDAFRAISKSRARTAAATEARKLQRDDQRDDQRNVHPIGIYRATPPSQDKNLSPNDDFEAAVEVSETSFRQPDSLAGEDVSWA